MYKVIALSLLVVLMGCTATSPDQAPTCIRGDPGGSQWCQAKTYFYAP
ncbi:MAG TPA: hypothetical protein PLG77_01145 [Burkholderiaceae bacterium]|nr:hypothetical protein [Burkholderiaceae bacterium]HRP27022.1 hypothetical protein [Burkholderiaceae bacterium]